MVRISENFGKKIGSTFFQGGRLYQSLGICKTYYSQIIYEVMYHCLGNWKYYPTPLSKHPDSDFGAR